MKVLTPRAVPGSTLPRKARRNTRTSRLNQPHSRACAPCEPSNLATHPRAAFGNLTHSSCSSKSLRAPHCCCLRSAYVSTVAVVVIVVVAHSLLKDYSINLIMCCQSWRCVPTAEARAFCLPLLLKTTLAVCFVPHFQTSPQTAKREGITYCFRTHLPSPINCAAAWLLALRLSFSFDGFSIFASHFPSLFPFSIWIFLLFLFFVLCAYMQNDFSWGAFHLAWIFHLSKMFTLPPSPHLRRLLLGSQHFLHCCDVLGSQLWNPLNFSNSGSVLWFSSQNKWFSSVVSDISALTAFIQYLFL